MRFRFQFSVQLLSSILNVITFIVLTPVLISALGLERYGVLLLILGFLVYAGIAEFGLGVASSREIAASESEATGSIFGNALFLSLGFGIIGGSIFSLLAIPAIASLLVGDPNIVTELEHSFWPLFALGAMSVLASLPKGVLYGLSRFISLNVINLLGSIGALLAPALYATLIGTELSGLIAVTALTYGATFVVAFSTCLVFGAKPILRYESIIIRKLMSYGGWSTFSALLHRLVSSLDRIFISAFSGPAAVTFFAVPQSALNRSQMLTSAFLSAYFPRIARSPHNEGMIEICHRSMLLLSPLFVVGIFLLHPVLKFWLGEEFANQAHIASVLLAVAVWFETVGRVPHMILQARSELREETRIGALILIPNLLLLLLAVKLFGVAGAAAIAIVRNGAFVVLRSRATHMKSSLSWSTIWHSLAIGLASTACIFQSVDDSFLAVMALGSISILLSLGLNLSYGLQLAKSLFPIISKVPD